MSKVFTKTVAGISALAILAAMPCMTAFAAEAENAAEADFTAAQLPVLHYSPEDVSAIDCRFYEDLPNVPYVKLSDYYTLWVDDTLEITNRGDGVFDVKVPYGTTGVFDTVKDTVTAEDRPTFLEPLENHDGSDYTQHLFVQEADDAEDDADDKTALSLELAKYNIDLRSSGDDLWCPLPTLCDMFYHGMRNASYMENTLIFGKDLTSNFMNYLIARSPEHASALIEQYQNGRPADFVKYNYDELCFAFDLYYGFPGRSPYTELMREKGLDGMLSEGNDSTRYIKELLNSESLMDYSVGIDLLNGYLWDGGHTTFTAAPLTNQDYIAQFREKAAAYNLNLENSIDYVGDQYITGITVNSVYAARQAMLENEGADYTEEMPGAFYIEKGDTAIFSFEQFVVSAEGWKGYYLENGELPQDVLTSFYQAVRRADENPAIKNFVVDLGTNVGGITLVVQYMMNIMTGLDHVMMADNTLGKMADEPFKVDKNLDKAFDEKDAAFKTDLRYGIIISQRSFSCGNWMPSLAKDNGILLMGEQSGGGACAVEYHVTADGIPFAISTGTTLLDQEGKSIDAGIKPHYENVKYLEDGSKDFSETYNFANISKYFDEFYGTAEEVTTPAETTAPESATSETTTTTTVTTAVTSGETTAVQTTETNATETTAPQTAAKKYSVSDLKKMASKDYESKNGKAPANTAAKENADGTVTIEITDAAGKVLDTYTVNPDTGIGKDSKGGEVNLPQTGNNSLGTAAALAAALLLLGAGSAAVAGSGVLRRKDEEK